VPDDRLAAAAAELYGAAPEEFTVRRGELAAAARNAGDRNAAKAIGGLRRPTRAAWVVNTLARSDPGATLQLTELAAALSAAQRAGQGQRLRELSAERWALIDALTAQALGAAGVADPPPSLRDEVAQTISAALSDSGVAAEFAAGTLTRAAHWSGFGVEAAGERPGDGDDADSGTLPAAWAAAARTRAPTAAQAPATANAPATARAPAGAQATAGATTEAPAKTRAARDAAAPEADRGTREAARREADRAAREAAAPETDRGTREAARREADRAAREAAKREAEQEGERAAAERAARRREQRLEAERRVAAATAAAAEANAAEDRLAAEVRDLEQRLTQARDELATARMRARRAEVAERRARQAASQL
jgi:hypothetical protein